MAKTVKTNTLANKIGYNFADQNLFKRAVTHSSKSEENYERLEFLGDGILDFVVGEYLFTHTNEKEGKLTVLRSHYVSENNLCKIFDRLNISSEVILGKSYQGEISKAIKGDIIEAIIASIYLDGGLEEAKKFIYRNFELENFANVVDDNYKSKLQELVQSSFKCHMQYKTEPNEKGFISTFYMDEDAISLGQGLSKIEAEQQAAKKAIEKLFLIDK